MLTSRVISILVMVAVKAVLLFHLVFLNKLLIDEYGRTTLLWIMLGVVLFVGTIVVGSLLKGRLSGSIGPILMLGAPVICVMVVGPIGMVAVGLMYLVVAEAGLHSLMREVFQRNALQTLLVVLLPAVVQYVFIPSSHDTLVVLFYVVIAILSYVAGAIRQKRQPVVLGDHLGWGGAVIGFLFMACSIPMVLVLGSTDNTELVVGLAVFFNSMGAMVVISALTQYVQRFAGIT
ncbi:MAG: hypothetical protein KBD24_04165 [Candidatus Pacebacteria bacterium]|nr:hypothetical protein [Candidatus Paceibacterota bacterium]